jgi:hypothetical protein
MGIGTLWFRQRKIGAMALLLWLVLWIGFAVVVLFPETAVVVAHLLGISRGVDLALYLSVILIFFVLFRIYMRLEQVDRQITQIVRAVALREAGLEHQENKGGRDLRPGEKV